MTHGSRSLAATAALLTAACAVDQAGLDPAQSSDLAVVDIVPDSVELPSGDTVRFVVQARRADGTSTSAVITFSGTGGTIDQTGLYRAGFMPGRYRVVGRRAGIGPSIGDSSVVVIQRAPTGGGPLGVNADLVPRRLFPADNAWNRPVDAAPVDPNSDAIIAAIGATTRLHPDFGADWNGGPFGIPYVVVSGTQARVPVTFDYADESDPGPYPIPLDPPIEGGPDSDGDRHILIVDRDKWVLYELFAAFPNGDGSWRAGSGAVFDLASNAFRPAGWTSADAAGLPILAGLVRYDEVESGEITHALRFTVSRTRRAYIHPARHWASTDDSPLRPPMGMRVRLKAGFDTSGYPPRVQIILRALKTYGMIVADHGSNWYVSGVADPRWDDSEINTLKQVRGSNFEVVRMDGVVTP